MCQLQPGYVEGCRDKTSLVVNVLPFRRGFNLVVEGWRYKTAGKIEFYRPELNKQI